ncbi:MAG: outer membrane beta-barrel protein, partial [Hyphomonadaceae bacterium]
FSGAKGNASETLQFDTNRDGAFGDTVLTSTSADAFAFGFCGDAAIGPTLLSDCRKSDGNLNLAVRAGYDWQFGPWVLGIVGEASHVKIGDDVSGFSSSLASYTFTRDLDFTLAVRGRAGFANDRYLAYGTAGMAMGNLDRSFTTTNTTNTFTPSGGDDAVGYQVGAGLEVQWSDNATFGLEYLLTSLNDDSYVVDAGAVPGPATNPFLTANPAGTFIRRRQDAFEYDTVSFTSTWRY